jgi:peptidoglycan/xylan/chitin deacetylase (PgdA/CDA1 family)
MSKLKSRIMKYGLMVGFFVAVWMVAPGNTNVWAANLISNGDFLSGTSPWTVAVKNGAAATLSDFEGWGKVAITALPNPSRSNVILRQTFNADLIAGTQYTLSFTAKADATKTIDAYIYNSSGGTISYKTFQNIGTGSKEYSHTFTPSATYAGAYLGFRVGGEQIDIYFANVAVNDGTGPTPTPTITPTPTPTPTPTSTTTPSVPPTPTPGGDKGGETIILKLDDLKDSSLFLSQFGQVYNMVIQKNVKAGFGIIGNSLEDNGAKQNYYDTIRNWDASGRIEIWHHGYDHLNTPSTEFTMPYDHQYDHLQRTIDLLLSKCGITVHSFGAPFNANNADTVTAMNAFPQMKVWMFPGAFGNQLPLNGVARVDMELDINGTTVVDYPSFVTNYYNSPSKVMVLQGHPSGWSTEEFSEFGQIIDFLQSMGCVFKTPYEYYLSTSLSPPLLINGDFAGGTSPWTLSLGYGAAATLLTSSGWGYVDISSGGASRGSVELLQTLNASLVSGKIQIISFDVKAAVAKTFDLIIRDSANNIIYSKYNLSADTTSKHFAYAYIPPATYSGAKLCFRVGGDTTDIYFDNVIVNSYN